MSRNKVLIHVYNCTICEPDEKPFMEAPKQHACMTVMVHICCQLSTKIFSQKTLGQCLTAWSVSQLRACAACLQQGPSVLRPHSVQDTRYAAQQPYQ